MPRSSRRPQPKHRLPKGKLSRLQRLRSEMSRENPSGGTRGESPESFTGKAIGRRIIGGLAELDEDARQALKQAGVEYHPEGAGLIYARAPALKRYAGSIALSRENIADQIEKLGARAQVQLQINRGQAQLAKSPQHDPSVDTYDLYAPILAAYKDEVPTAAPREERAQIERFLHLKDERSSSSDTLVWLGYLSMPAGSSAADSVESILDEAWPDSFMVSSVQLFTRPPKK